MVSGEGCGGGCGEECVGVVLSQGAHPPARENPL